LILLQIDYIIQSFLNILFILSYILCFCSLFAAQADIMHIFVEKVRDIIGFDNGSDLKVVDCTMYRDSNPSLKLAKSSL